MTQLKKTVESKGEEEEEETVEGLDVRPFLSRGNGALLPVEG